MDSGLVASIPIPGKWVRYVTYAGKQDHVIYVDVGTDKDQDLILGSDGSSHRIAKQDESIMYKGDIYTKYKTTLSNSRGVIAEGVTLLSTDTQGRMYFASNGGKTLTIDDDEIVFGMDVKILDLKLFNDKIVVQTKRNQLKIFKLVNNFANQLYELNFDEEIDEWEINAKYVAIITYKQYGDVILTNFHDIRNGQKLFQHESENSFVGLTNNGFLLQWSTDLYLYSINNDFTITEIKPKDGWFSEKDRDEEAVASTNGELMFLESGKKIDVYDPQKMVETEVQKAVEQNDPKKLKMLFDKGEDPFFDVYPYHENLTKDMMKIIINARFGEMGSDLFKSIVARNWTGLIKKYGKTLDEKTLSDGLRTAVEFGNLGTTDLLLKLGANPNDKPKAITFCDNEERALCLAKLLPITDVSDLLDHAISRKLPKIVDEFINRGHPITDEMRPFSIAAQHNRKDYIEYMLNKGLLPSVSDQLQMKSYLKNDEIERMVTTKKLTRQNRDYHASSEQFNEFLKAAKKIALSFRKLKEKTEKIPTFGQEIVSSLHGFPVKTEAVKGLPLYCKKLYVISQLASEWIDERYFGQSEYRVKLMKRKEKIEELSRLSEEPNHELRRIAKKRLSSLPPVMLPKYDTMIPYELLQKVNESGEKMSLSQLLFKFKQLSERIDECFLIKINPVLEEYEKQAGLKRETIFDGVERMRRRDQEEIRQLEEDHVMAARLNEELNNI